MNEKNTVEISATLLVKLLTKLALTEHEENIIREKAAMIERYTGEKLPECNCPACLMPNLAVELNDEILAQVGDAGALEDMADKDEVDRIVVGLEQYAIQREQMILEDAMKNMTGPEN